MALDKSIFTEWLKALVSTVNTLIEDGKSVKLIALSRKMPRLINWMQQSFSEDDIKSLTEIIDNPKVELTTEHGIPFIFANYNLDYDKIIVLDDIVVYGETLLSVANEIRYLTGKTPICHPIFALERTMDDFDLSMLENYKPKMFDSIEEVRSTINDLSEEITSSGLPIDIEFPIVHLKQVSFGSIRDKLLETFKEARSYDLSCNVADKVNVGRSFTVLLEDEINRAFNNDFAKIRLFDVDYDPRLVCYAPNMLSEGQLESEELFEDCVYASLWTRILKSGESFTNFFNREDISVTEQMERREFLEHRWLKSLAVAANYMFSLSMLMRNLKKFMPNVSSEAINRRDLELIFGRELTQIVEAYLGEIVNAKIESPSRRRMLDVPDEIVPKQLGNQFDVLKVFETVKASTDELKILSLFRLSYSLKNSLSKNVRPSLRVMQNVAIYESFESLYNLPFKSIRSKEGENVINKTVDWLIDRGGLIPVYLPVIAKNRLTYWRRFFRASHIIGMLEKESR